MSKVKFVQQTAENIGKSISTIARNGVKLSQLIQLACIQVIGHVFAHGDTSLANKLVEAVGSHNRAAVAAFLEKHGPLAWSKTEKRFLHFKRKDVTFDQTYIDNLPHWENAKRPAEIRSMYDVDVEAEKFLNRMAKLAASDTVTLKEKPLLEALIDCRNTYISKKYLAKGSNTEPSVSADPVVIPAAKAA
jgi:hypothetical protein